MHFEYIEVDVSDIGFTAFLLRFREKGIVTIVDGTCDRILLLLHRRPSVPNIPPLVVSDTYMYAVHASVDHRILMTGPENESGSPPVSGSMG